MENSLYSRRDQSYVKECFWCHRLHVAIRSDSTLSGLSSEAGVKHGGSGSLSTWTNRPNADLEVGYAIKL